MYNRGRNTPIRHNTQQPPQQQYGPRPQPQQQPRPITAYDNHQDDHMQQGSSTGRRNNRRRDVRDFYPNNNVQLSGASKRGLNNGDGDGVNGQQDSKKQKNRHFGTNFGMKGSGGKASSSKLAENLASSVVSQLCGGIEVDTETGKLTMKNKPEIKEYADMYMGNFRGIIDKNSHAASFKKGLKDQKCPTDNLIVPATSINLPKSSFNKLIRNCYLKFSIGWFDNLRLAIWKRDNNKTEDDMLLDAATADLNSVKTTDIFDKIAELAEQQINSIIEHYKPSGNVYVIIQSGSICDAIIGAHCIVKNIPIIQLDHDSHNPKLGEIKDEHDRAYTFGFRIGQIIRLGLKKKSKVIENKELVDDEVFDMSKI